LQSVAALGNGEHAVPQAPQLAGSLLTSWQLAPQQVSLPAWQGCEGEQPWAHAPAEQIWPLGQSVSKRHSLHWFVLVSHLGVGAEQSLSSSQPAPHFCVDGLQYWP
jgi:hypothetical protein